MKKNPIAQRLIKTLEKPSHLTHEDVGTLDQLIKEGQTAIKFDLPFKMDGHQKE